MKQSDSLNELASALAKAHLSIENPALDGNNPHFGSKFATLAAHLNAVRRPLAENGISVVQSVSSDTGQIVLTTRLLHSSGQWMEDSMAFPMPEKATAQTAGSLLTYARRYSLAAICGIVGEQDDDGESDRQAGPRGTMQPVRPRAERKDWPESGTVQCTLLAATPRSDGVWGVQVDCEYGRSWVRCDDTMGNAALAECARASKKSFTLAFRRDGAVIEASSLVPTVRMDERIPASETERVKAAEIVRQEAGEEEWTPIKVGTVERVENRKRFSHIRVVLDDGTELRCRDESSLPALQMYQQGAKAEAVLHEGLIVKVRDAS